MMAVTSSCLAWSRRDSTASSDPADGIGACSILILPEGCSATAEDSSPHPDAHDLTQGHPRENCDNSRQGLSARSWHQWHRRGGNPGRGGEVTGRICAEAAPGQATAYFLCSHGESLCGLPPEFIRGPTFFRRISVLPGL